MILLIGAFTLLAPAIFIFCTYRLLGFNRFWVVVAVLWAIGVLADGGFHG